jgi:glyoxylase-like metal-dependent hydrolase (beta-lactamase superfamily II)
MSERVSPLVRRVVAPNPGPFTYKGTCSYIVGAGEVAIVDPGPANPSHIEALIAATADEAVRYVLVTHTHRDHSPAARILAERLGAEIVGCAPHKPADPGAVEPGLDASHDDVYCPDRALADGDLLCVGGATIETLATPGHTANHLCFALREERAVFTGDHVMAWSTTVIAPPDGSMGAYMRSIERLRERDDAIFWPGHGGPVTHPQRYLRALVHHRRQREAAILQRLDAGDATIPRMVDEIYQGLDPRLHRAAALTVLAHLEDMCERGLVASDGGFGMGSRFRKFP